MYVQNAIYLCTKCYVCYIDCPLTVSLLLFAKIHHRFKCTWSFSLSSNAHAQNIGTRTVLLRKSEESFDAAIVKILRKLQYWAKKHSHKGNDVYFFSKSTFGSTVISHSLSQSC